ncbi:hypothetical protein KQI63_14345 [bacterium]|nr:hypothetical protein [bacterium]
MRGIRTLALVLAGLLLTGGAIKASAQSIEVLDEKTVRVESRGMVEGIKKKKEREALAFKKAKENAILIVINDMLRSPDEKEAFEKVKDQIMSDTDLFVQHATYLEKSNYDKPIYQTTVRLHVTIIRDVLQQKLVALKVISSAADVRKELDRFTIMPYLDLANSSPDAAKYKELFYTRVRVFFQDQGIPTIGQDEIAAIESDEQVVAMSKSSSGEEGQEDLVLQMARNTPADVFIKISAQIESGSYGGATTKKVILTVGAYNAMTGEFIGSGQGFSEPMALSSDGASVGAGIDQAMNNAMTRVMDSVTSFWRDYTKNGRPVKLIFTDFSFGDMRWVRDALKDLAKDQKRLKAAGNVDEYMVWYDGSAEDLMYSIYDVFAANDVKLSGDPEMVSNTIRFYRAQ